MRGDLLFVTPDLSDPVEAMIHEYDRGDYTHVGIDDGAGNLLNCRLSQDSLREGKHGGVRCDPQSAFTGRLHRSTVSRPTRDKDNAAAFAERLVDTGGVDRSGFSLAKMFACAAAVDLSDQSREFSQEARDNVVGAARRVAETWRYSTDFPFFFCAELVVEAYGAEVPAEYLPPPPPKERVEGVEPAELDVDLVTGPVESTSDDDRHRALAHLFFSVGRHDPVFFGEAGASLIRWFFSRHHGEDPGGPGPTEFRPEPLPAGLVTPRMLLRCIDWVGPAEPV